MIYSYDKVYLRIAQRVLGEMLNYAVYDCGYELNEGRAGHSCDGCAG